MAANIHKTIYPASVAANILFSTVQILTTTKQGKKTGTGFIYRHDLKTENIKNRGLPFLVTNRHVVEDAEVGQIVFLKSADKILQEAIAGAKFHITIPNFIEAWHFHEDPEVDLAIMQLSTYLNVAQSTHGVRLFMRSITLKEIPTDADVQAMDAIEDVLMVGYPNSLMDELNHLPITRRGITATPYVSDYQGRLEFLIDASIFPGSSGSPIFLIDHHKSDSDRSKRVFLLGILSAGFYRVSEALTIKRDDIQATIPNFGMKEMLDIGVVVKSRRLVEMVSSWENKYPVASQKEQELNSQKAAQLTDREINTLIYKLQKVFHTTSWTGLEAPLRSSYTWHLLNRYKTVGLSTMDRLLLYTLLQHKRAEIEGSHDLK